MNRLRVLDAVRENGALTQVEIAGVTGLSAASVSNLVRELDAAGAVRLSPSIRNGRRAVQVSFAASHGLVAAIVFGDRDVRVAIGTSGAEIVSHKRMPLPADHAADEGMTRGSRLLFELMQTSAHTMSELRAVSVGLPAPIDRVTGQVGSEGILPGWRGVPVATAMEEALSTKVLLENTANLAALGEAKFGALQGISTGIFIKASYGVGAGLIIGGELFRGSAGTAGEIGHVTIDEDGPICRCGNRGCLDTFVGAQAVLGALRGSHGALTLRDVINTGARRRSRLPPGARGLRPAHRGGSRRGGQPAQPARWSAWAARWPGWARSSCGRCARRSSGAPSPARPPRSRS